MRTRWIMVGVLALACCAPMAWAQPAPSRDEQPPRPAMREDGPGDPDEGWLLAELGPDGDDELMAPRDGEGPGGAMGMRRGGPDGAGGMGMRRGGGMGRMHGWGEQRGALREKLNLTEAQKSRMGELRERQMRHGIEGRAQIQLAGLDLRKLMRADKPDTRAIDAQIDRIASLRADLQKTRIATMFEARAVLTPAQQKILQDARSGRGMQPPPPGDRRKL